MRLSFVVEAGDRVRDGASESVGVSESAVGELMLLEVAPASFDVVQLRGALVQKSDCRRGQAAWGAVRQCAGTPACPAGSSGSAPRRRPWPRSSGRAESGRGGRDR